MIEGQLRFLAAVVTMTVGVCQDREPFCRCQHFIDRCVGVLEGAALCPIQSKHLRVGFIPFSVTLARFLWVVLAPRYSVFYGFLSIGFVIGFPVSYHSLRVGSFPLCSPQMYFLRMRRRIPSLLFPPFLRMTLGILSAVCVDFLGVILTPLPPIFALMFFPFFVSQHVLLLVGQLFESQVRQFHQPSRMLQGRRRQSLYPGVG